MDEASRLISELQGKLAELDHKVWQYKKDMTCEFTKYAESLLRDVSKDVSETVSKAMADSMKDFKSLNVDATATGSAGPCAVAVAGTSILENGAEKESHLANTSLSISNPREEDVGGSPNSPYDREKELQGLFTPSYLPLLENTNRHERRASSDSQSQQLEYKGKEKETDIVQVDASTDTRSLMNSPELRRPPTPRRRNTDEVSISSEWSSDGTSRRSALRRASTSSGRHLTSPRRVRFEVEGEEVLPTSSPLPSQSILSTDIPEDPQSFGDDSDEEAGLEQIEDIDEPPPKRISSSQALRALSRGPLVDDGTQWTTVTAPPDGSASVAISGGISHDSSSESLPTNGLSRLNIADGYGLEQYSEQVEESSQKSSSTSQGRKEGYDSETSSDDDMLDMPPLRSMKGQKSAQSPTYATPLEYNRSPTTSTKSSGLSWIGNEDFGKLSDGRDGDLRFTEDDQEQVFDFEENIHQVSPPEAEEDHDESDTESPSSPAVDTGGPANLSLYSQSPARPIIKPSRQKATAATDSSGTFNGHPFSIPIVSPEVHAQAASLGDINTFVGSIHDRDEGDLLSYRQSGAGSFSGTPKSMSERLYMDDRKEADESRMKGAK